MSQSDVPEADRQEQQAAATDDPSEASTDVGEVPEEAPVADVYEQRLPPVAGATSAPFDAERAEPADDEWGEEG